VHILWYDVSTIQQAGCHVLSILGVTLDHLVVLLEAGHRNLLNAVGLVSRFGWRHNWRVRNEGEVNTGIWHKVGLELVEINVKGAIETERSSD
jgi:hypothetical protein